MNVIIAAGRRIGSRLICKAAASLQAANRAVLGLIWEGVENGDVVKMLVICTQCRSQRPDALICSAILGKLYIC